MSGDSVAGRLYLIPASLGDAAPAATTPAEVQRTACALDYFVVENAKTARAELRRLDHPLPLREIEIVELAERASSEQLDALLAPILAGRDGGLMSEAGCPAVADPGARLVARAHRQGVRVVPLVGPSSILLALMASGLDGQRFSFHGYLPIDEAERSRRIKELEAESRRQSQTQIFIETPYRNERMLASLLAACRDTTRLCVARSLTTTDEWIVSQAIAQWKKAPPPDLARQPTIFLMLADA